MKNSIVGRLRSSSAEPFQIAYETVQQFDNVILQATTDTGLTGWSCAAPDQVITGESADGVLESFHSIIEPILKGCDPFRFAKMHSLLRAQLSDQRSALAMADMLLYDLVAKSAEQPLYKLLGGFRDSILTSMTIGIMPLESAIARATKHAADGFRCLKIKGGLNVDEDIQKTRKIREAVGSEIELRFDGNQGYSVDEAVKFVHETSIAKVELLEQPTPHDLDDQLGEVVGRTSIPIMADESLRNLKDVFRLTRHDCADMINIKLMKVGGITEAAHINSVARAANVPCMVGCLEECELGIAFGLHFCLSRPNLFYADLDSSFDIVDDPFRGLVRIHNGVLHPLDEDGIGNPFCER